MTKSTGNRNGNGLDGELDWNEWVRSSLPLKKKARIEHKVKSRPHRRHVLKILKGL